ncbi:hypothetical protein TSAR_008255 [Trichomalopsis sarcophagae]|uniref:USP domain-containing protein n=1 Tax=Trichomalopsis sarcophagae TaxID=543379 RepID=A0A232ETA3_9HYME|nr:hypothetical protein TSAR_008255 [Trichomalopsis sarcophagae]
MLISIHQGKSIKNHFIDCIIEILCTVYTLVQKFKAFVDNPQTILQEINTEFLLILQEYVANFNLTALYKVRVKFIAKICQADDNKFSWNGTVGEFYKKVMFPNILLKYHCTDCNKDSYEHCNIIKLPYKQLLHDNSIVQLTFQPGDQCEICKKSDVSTEIEVNYLLCFDVEESTNDAINLNDIQVELKLGPQTLILMGAIGFQEPIQTQKLRHYIAYSRNFNGSWLKYDNAQSSSKISGLQ